MNIINNTESTLTFKYGEEDIELEPGQVFPFDGFQIENLKEIQQLVKLGLVTFYDNEDTEEVIPYNLISNRDAARKLIRPKNIGVFKHLNFDKVELD